MILPFLLVSLAVLWPSVVAAGDATTSLAKMIAVVEGNADITTEMLPLEQDWIGDPKDEKGEIERLRLEKGKVLRGKIILLRTDPYGRHLESEAPVLIKFIPSDEKLRSCTRVEELMSLLGPGKTDHSGWGGPRGLHSSHSWTCFDAITGDRLVYVRVFAMIHWEAKEQSRERAHVDSLLIRRGELRPADPGNPKERATYLSGADIFHAGEAAKAKARERYPQPLRDLVAVSEHPDDSKLERRSAAIQAIRDAPDTKLFSQLVGEMHEGTVRIGSLLEDILLNERASLDLKPWGRKEEATAVEACIDALHLAQAQTRDNLIAILLRVYGGGRIEIAGENGGKSIEISVTLGGYSMTISQAKAPLSLEDAKMELLRLYNSSRAK